MRRRSKRRSVWTGTRFPFLFGGTFIEAAQAAGSWKFPGLFPFLFGGTFIEAVTVCISETESTRHFPSFSEGLSLRVRFAEHALTSQRRFPFLLGRAFIEAILAARHTPRMVTFPYFSVGTFIEAMVRRWRPPRLSHFPFFFWRGFP